MIACQLGDTQIVKSLLAEQNIDVNAVDNVRIILHSGIIFKNLDT